jgi:hypothetical protein
MNSPPVPILSQTNPVQITPSHLSKIHLNIIHHLCLGLPSGLFPSGYHTNNLYAFRFSLIRATWPAHLILLHLIILIILLFIIILFTILDTYTDRHRIRPTTFSSGLWHHLVWNGHTVSITISNEIKSRVMTPCNLVAVYERFGVKYRFQF